MQFKAERQNQNKSIFEIEQMSNWRPRKILSEGCEAS